MRVVAAAATLALLVFSVAPVEADPGLERIHVDEAIHLAQERICVSVFCMHAANETGAPRVFLGAQSSLRAARLTLDSERPLPPGVEAVLRLDCDPSGPACGLHEEVRGQLPLQIAARGLDTPPGAVLRLYAHTEGLDPEGFESVPESIDGWEDVENPGLKPRDATIRGVLVSERDADYHPGLVEDTVAVAFDGVTSPCLFYAEPQCYSYPRGTYYETGHLAGPATALRLVATWEADTPLSENLRLVIACSREGDLLPLGVPCQPWPAPEGHPYKGESYVEGPSPLVLELDGLQTTVDSVYTIYVTGVVRDTPGTGLPDPTHETYHVDGEFTILVPDA